MTEMIKLTDEDFKNITSEMKIELKGIHNRIDTRKKISGSLNTEDTLQSKAQTKALKWN